MANQINDAVVAYGSRVITTSRGQVYFTDNFEYKRGKKSVLRTNQLDIPTGKVTTGQDITGTATFQYSAATTMPPQMGDTFPGNAIDAQNGVTTWIIDVNPDQAEKKDGETKIKVEFYGQIGATAPVVT